MAAFAGAYVLTGCGKSSETGDKEAKQSPSASPGTDAARLREIPPAADAASAKSTRQAWRYSHLAAQDSTSYQALAVASRDDVWLLGTRTQSLTPFLERWDGKRWSEPALPGDLMAGGRRSSWALATGGQARLWLAQRTVDAEQLAVFHRQDGSWQRLPDPPAFNDDHRSAGETKGAWLVASGEDLWVIAQGKVVHWDGQRWDAPALPFPAAALAAAPAGSDSPRAWVAGSVDSACGQEECYPQPATARWEDGAWQQLKTPSYRFPDPVPPEASATLDTIVHDPASDRLWALGRHDFNHGEVEKEPDTESILLTGDGTAWRKVSAPETGRAFMTSTTVADGAGGLLVDSRTHRTRHGKTHKLADPDRLPEPSEVPKAKRKYDFKQPFEIAATRLIPGTRTVLAVGTVTFNNSSDTGDPPQRAALARYDAV
ncbi:hypothetical protein DY218_28895 [Streptomyces triticagri]|uniref:Exo-alpha-sialidase n=1 Tax=Streptomyces triticagri TaxID=2293568 RepID=A0A372LX38_9ACTN|nr:hypothetical protein [Streptomyces triticagri]RFU83216.1 hypothetical protein DY218_28895 [Streptomyces triticagri]